MDRTGLFMRGAVAVAGVLLLAACATPGRSPLPPAATPAPFITARPAATEAPGSPPRVSNDAPAGVCEGTADVRSEVVRVPAALFRAVALDTRAGPNDGDGISFVRFTITSGSFAYVKEETQAPYCALGGNEPDCGAWPRDETGRYSWGAGGPPVEPGTYAVFVEIVSALPDSQTGSDTCSWTFQLHISSEK